MPKKNLRAILPAHPVPHIQITESEVFILESLRLQDEQAKRFEGRILSDILTLCGKHPIYYYFRTPDELVHFSTLFRESGYRYLHLSCHGHAHGIETTLGVVSPERFADIFKGILRNRRLFISACSIGKGPLPQLVREKNKGMYSVACPMDDIPFTRAAAIWAAFYVRMFDVSTQTNGPSTLKNAQIRRSLKSLCQLFDVQFQWSYDRSNDNSKLDTWIDEIVPPSVRKVDMPTDMNLLRVL
jgi:hypothetical protein